MNLKFQINHIWLARQLGFNPCEDLEAKNKEWMTFKITVEMKNAPIGPKIGVPS